MDLLVDIANSPAPMLLLMFVILWSSYHGYIDAARTRAYLEHRTKPDFHPPGQSYQVKCAYCGRAVVSDQCAGCGAPTIPPRNERPVPIIPLRTVIR